MKHEVLEDTADEDRVELKMKTMQLEGETPWLKLRTLRVTWDMHGTMKLRLMLIDSDENDEQVRPMTLWRVERRVRTDWEDSERVEYQQADYDDYEHADES